MKPHRLPTALAALLLGLLLNFSAQATVIGFDFTGTVGYVSSDFGANSGISDGPGSKVQGYLVYDTAVADMFAGDPVYGRYMQTAPGTGVGFTFQSGATVANDGEFFVEVQNLESSTGDWDFFGAGDKGALINGVPVANVFFAAPALTSFLVQTFPSDALPTALQLSDFQLTDGYMVLSSCVGRGCAAAPSIAFNIDTLTPHDFQVPEPATALLLAFAALPFARRRRRFG
jgi:hypothetical protein